MTTKTEQFELIEELTLKLQETEVKLAGTVTDNQYETAQAVVRTHVVGSMALGLLPLPLFDIAALTGAQLNMLHSLCKHYEVAFDDKIGKALLSSLASGSVPILTVVGLSSVVKIIPGVGSIIGGVSVSVLSGSMIYAAGQVFIRHFEAGGTLEDFDSNQWLDFFKQQFEKGKVELKGQYGKSKTVVKDGIVSSKGLFKRTFKKSDTIDTKQETNSEPSKTQEVPNVETAQSETKTNVAA